MSEKPNKQSNQQEDYGLIDPTNLVVVHDYQNNLLGEVRGDNKNKNYISREKIIRDWGSIKNWLKEKGRDYAQHLNKLDSDAVALGMF